MIEKFCVERLLGREAIHVYGPGARELIEGKTILVTGAGGSIGSEIVRQMRLLEAGKVYYVDNDEFALYNLQMGTEGVALLDDDAYCLADVKDEQLMRRIMQEVQPDIVFHAAAHKHLPLLERAPEAAVKTNVFGTESVILAAIAANVDRVVNISTDKAANPTSALGWSKRLAEHVVAKYAGTSATKVVSVRFGNVLGSRGSFLPTLITQMENGQTVRLTDPEVSRFFMTIPEAAGLVIEAACLAEQGETYVLDMGSPVRIQALINRFVELSGHLPPEIEYTGLRPGEKLSEELFDRRETYYSTAHPRILKADVGYYPIEETLALLRHLITHSAHPALVRSALEFNTDRKADNGLVHGACWRF
ncbi:polysaccharide biosynthesis protein [Arthrobacter sp. NA-172]|uniref:polysaccharide biosynthesis protein n=1 Tax=Arthrobacter sp. NA-172 TaxID=3367524 RepID=UPI003754332F